MFLSIMKHEIFYRLRQISTYVYYLVFLVISFLLMSAAGGAFKGVNINMFREGENVFVNSPMSIAIFTVMLFYFGVIVIASVFGNIAVKEFENQSFSLLYTKPIKKIDYLLGKFLAGVILSLFIFSSIGLGLFIATLMPYMIKTAIGPNHLSHFILPYLYFIIPNSLLIGGILFIIALHSRKILSAYIGALVLFIGYMSASALTSDYANSKIAGLIDPYGINSIMMTVKYWSGFEVNNRLLPFSGLIMQNRMIWLSISGILFISFAIFFKMRYHNESTKSKQESEIDHTKRKLIEYDNSKTVFSFESFILPVIRWTKLEFSNIIKNVYFIVILVIYLFFLITSATQVGKIFGTSTYPVTYIVVQILTGSYLLFSIILSTFYAGELIWKERINKTDQIIDAMPFKTSIAFISKFSAIILMQLIFMGLILIVGLFTQVLNGYYNFEISNYLFDLLALRLPSVVIFTLLAMFLQTLFNNKYLGYFAVIIFYGFIIMSSSLSLDHNLLIFNKSSAVSYSDLNSYGHFLKPFFLFKLYWLLFSIILSFIALKIWVRGKESLLKVRFKHFFTENKSVKSMFGILVLFIGLGSYLFYNTNIVNKYHTSKYYENKQSIYEKTYKYLEKVIQPRITEVFVQADMYPSERKLKVRGYYWLKNKQEISIQEIIVNNTRYGKNFKISFDRSSKLKSYDKDFEFYIYRLDKVLQPGDSIRMNYSAEYQEKGIKNDESNTEIIYNGTFIHNDYMPSLGYNKTYELSDNRSRKKYGLKESIRMAKIDDLKARMNVYISHDADWVKYAAIVSTSEGQIPFAPGNLVREWHAEHRVYREYKLDTPVLNFFTFVSGKYEVKKDKVRGINIEIYYHKGHEYNIDSMMESAKNSLGYFSDNFSPYPHKVLRIIEVPNYVQYAQSIPTMIPFSEALGFIAKVDPKDPKDVNYPYYVTSHEIAHQWWAHQVIGADVQGSTMLSEALAQYSSLMCMKAKYGDLNMKRFLGYELDAYLVGRSKEDKVENPLYLVENQQYIHYNKGSLAMYALQDNIGENRVNQALGKFCKAYAYKNPPYPISLDLIAYLQEVTPDSSKYLIDDLFKKIIIFDLGIKSVKESKVGKKYIYTLLLDNKKMEADSLGKYQDLVINDWVDIAFYEKNNSRPIYIKKHHINSLNQSLSIELSKKAEYVEIDPIRKLIDKYSENNKQKI